MITIYVFYTNIPLNKNAIQNKWIPPIFSKVLKIKHLLYEINYSNAEVSRIYEYDIQTNTKYSVC